LFSISISFLISGTNIISLFEMIVTLKNTQKTVKFNLANAKLLMKLLMKHTKVENWSVGVWFAGNQTIRKLNHFHRGKDQPTDIISFPFHGKEKLYRHSLVKFKGVHELG
jgi:ssRNA-specific RNase YbeY (16S rRNA maturation enzyme)